MGQTSRKAQSSLWSRTVGGTSSRGIRRRGAGKYKNTRRRDLAIMGCSCCTSNTFTRREKEEKSYMKKKGVGASMKEASGQEHYTGGVQNVRSRGRYVEV
eukprot:TRINITY_DN50247_c0_g1_i1.p2 TRINITY_DN50247_c0_g1~~TRINITY_DN50247_c0_g1_i1.p2  ORF type:complete len:100 (-),score=3.78 TRINITY_DN50247_c0_g1_i1:191-490(-)